MEEHHDRLLESGRMLGFTIPYSREEIDAAAMAVLEGNGISDGYLRPVAWRGSEMMAVSAQQTKTHVAVAAWQWPAYFAPEARLKGIRMTVADWKRPSPETAPCRSKAAGLYMICTLSKHAAEGKGYADEIGRASCRERVCQYV